MTVSGKYVRFEDELTPLLKVDTAKTKNGKGSVEISGPEGAIVSVAAKNIRNLAEKKFGFELPSLRKNSIEITAEDTSHGVVKMKVKIADLAKALGVTSNQIKNAENKGKLEEFILQSLKGKVQGEKSKISQVVEKEKSPQTVVEEKRTEKPPTINPVIRQEILQNLPSFGLTEEEFQKILQYYDSNKSSLETLKEPTHIRKGSVDPPLPRSVVYVPEGPRKGLYVLLKSHGGMKEIGLGSFNRATKALYLDQGQIKVFRDGKSEGVKEGEFMANQKAQGHTDLLAAGIPIKYKGPWRTRQRPKNEPKDHLPREMNVDKTGFIMDWMEGGELYDVLNTKTFTYKEAVFQALTIAKALQCFHDELGLVHLDLKPENIFMTKDEKPKVSDFGFAVAKGGATEFCGTPGFVDPAMVQNAMNGQQTQSAEPYFDIWSFGCIVAELAVGSKWYDWNGQSENDWSKLLMTGPVEMRKGILFPRRGDANHLDHWIDSCLKLNPKERPTAAELVVALEKIYAQV